MRPAAGSFKLNSPHSSARLGGGGDSVFRCALVFLPTAMRCSCSSYHIPQRFVANKSFAARAFAFSSERQPKRESKGQLKRDWLFPPAKRINGIIGQRIRIILRTMQMHILVRTKIVDINSRFSSYPQYGIFHLNSHYHFQGVACHQHQCGNPPGINRRNLCLWSSL